jgi:hypothetical protein
MPRTRSLNIAKGLTGISQEQDVSVSLCLGGLYVMTAAVC